MATLGQKIRSLIGDSLGASIVEYNLEKAIESAKKISSAPQSAFYNPMDMFMGREWIVKQGQALTYQDLRRMAMNPIIGSIIQTRLNQVASFAVPQQSYYDTGFVIKARNEGDLEAENNTTQKAKLRDFVYTCGAEGYGDTLLETFLRKFLRDSLVLDQACAEIVWTRDKMRPSYFIAVDSGTIRLLKSYLSYAVPPDTLTYVQVMDDVIRAAYTPSQMIFGVRNPQTDIRLLGYGLSELETLIRIVTLILNTERYNSSLLAQGGTQKGLLVVKGDLASEETYFEAFKRDFREAIRNASDYWRAPILRIGKEGDVTWLPIDRSQRDMEYAQLFDFLVKQACVIGATKVTMADGSKRRIEEIVKKKEECYVASMAPDGTIQNKRVLGFFKNSVRSDLLKVTFKGFSHKGHKGNVLKVTPDHRILVLKEKGEWIPAESLKSGDRVALINPRALSSLQEQVIRGSLLGDSCAYEGQSGYSVKYMQSVAQRDYFFWKHRLLARLTETGKLDIEPKPNNSSKFRNKETGEPFWNYQVLTRTSKELGEICEGIYRSGESGRHPTRAYLDKLTPLGLAVWFMDDGTLHKSNERPRAQIASEGFTREDNEIIVAYFKEVWGLDWNIRDIKQRPGHCYLAATTESTERFLEIISLFLAPSMLYKTNLDVGGGYEPEDEGGAWSVGEVVSIEPFKETLRTYCLEVEDNHNFFAEGVLVSNCGVYQMAPEEINWSIGATGAKVNFEAQSGSKLTHSQQKGLNPLLMFAQNLLNINVVQRIDSRYKMQFVGLNLDRGEDSTIHMREVQNYKTINEVRASTGLPPVKFGDVILNNAYLKMAVPGFSAPRAPSGNERDVSLNPEFDTSRAANQ